MRKLIVKRKKIIVAVLVLCIYFTLLTLVSFVRAPEVSRGVGENLELSAQKAEQISYYQGKIACIALIAVFVVVLVIVLIMGHTSKEKKYFGILAVNTARECPVCGKEISRKMQLLILFCVNLAVHLSVSIQVRPLYFSSDEMGVVAEAAYLIGEDWSQLVQHIGYYGYGQALFYIPIFALVQNPIYRYITFGCINSVLLSFIPILVYHILESLEFLSPKKRFYFALIVSLFPSHLVYTKWVWNEPLLCVLPWGLLWIIVRLITNRGNKVINSILLAAVSVWCYATHGRGLVFIIAVILTLIYACVVYKRIVINVPCFLSSFAAMFVSDHYIKNFFIENLWRKEPGQLVVNTFSATLEANIRPYFSLEWIMNTAKFMLGYAVNAILSSYGILIIVAVFFILMLFSKVARQKYLGSITKEMICRLTTIAAFCVLCFLGAFVLSAVVHSTSTDDYIIYTRYYANTLGLIILLGALIISETQFLVDKFKIIILVFACFIPFYIPIASLFNEATKKRPFVYFNLYPYMGKFENAELFSAYSSILIIFLLVMLIATSKYKKYTVLFSLCIFLSAYYYCSINFIIPESREAFEIVNTSYEVLTKIEGLSDYCNKVYFYNPDGHYIDSALQFMLPKYQVDHLNGIEAEQIEDRIADNGIIIAYEDLALEYLNKNYYRISNGENSDRFSAQYIWVHGEEGSQYIAEHGPYKPVNNYGQARLIDLNKFSTSVGTFSDEKIVSTGEEGYLLFGPYIPLNSGSYTLAIEGLLVSGKLSDTSFFDVASNSGEIEPFRVDNLQQFIKDNSFQLSVDFTITEDSKDCEFRLYVNGSAILEINQVSLKKNNL